MTKDFYSIKVPAKINLFLNIINKRKDGFHNILSGITFINLYDKITIKKSKKFILDYSGEFKPRNKYFEDDIILKTMSILNLKDDSKIHIKIEKNIPTLSGLGSASTNAAAFIKCLNFFSLIEKIDENLLSFIGSDVSACYYSRDCLLKGKGDIIDFNVNFPKIYILLIKPNINISTSKMYSKIKNFSNIKNNKSFLKDKFILDNLKNYQNIFQKIAEQEHPEIKNLLIFMSKIENCVFSRMSGSGSCCYAVFREKKYAINALKLMKFSYPDLWSIIGENKIKI